MPENVCFGWNEFFWSNWCVSVGLKNTLDNKDLLSVGFLNMVVSKKSTEFSLIVDFNLMFGLCEFKYQKSYWIVHYYAPKQWKLKMSSR